VKRITKQEFNMIEHHTLVLSYEQNIRRKEEALALKEKRLGEIVNQSEAMNWQIAEHLEKLIRGLKRRGGGNDRCGSRRAALEVSARQDNRKPQPKEERA
jgi:hypothetical protein